MKESFMAIDPAHLLLLPAIRAQGSITGAAEHTGRTAPAVSQQLARLERDIGARLVERSPQGARLTPLGARLADHAQRIDAALRDAAAHAAEFLDEHRDRLRLGAFPTAGRALLPEVLAALRHRHPGAELSIADLGPDDGMRLVAEHTLDLALVGEYSDPLRAPRGVELVHLMDDPVHAVVPVGDYPEGRPDGSVRLSDFASMSWACAPTTLPNREQLERVARSEGFRPRIPFESESYAVAEAVVSAGVAVSFIPRVAITGVPGTIDFPLDEPALGRRILAAVPTSRHHAPLTSVCLRLLHQVCADHTP